MSISRRGSLYHNLPAGPLPDEIVDQLAQAKAVRIERIVSTGQATSPGQWLEQAQHEWVVLLTGSAALSFEQDKSPIQMQPGDYLYIPGGTRHRVESTDTDQPTVWLAIHYDACQDGPGTQVKT